MRSNSYSDLVDYLNKENCYEDFIIKEIENFITLNADTFVENENIEPKIKVRDAIFSFGVTSMIL